MLFEVLSVITADYKKERERERERRGGGAREEHGEDVEAVEKFHCCESQR